MLGVCIINPVINAIFFQPDRSFLPEMDSETYRSLMFGLLVGFYPLIQFLGASILGLCHKR